MSDAIHAESLLADARHRREQSRPDAKLARSWQLVPGTAGSTFDQAQLGEADALVLDLGDSVDGSLKHAARADVATWLDSGGRAWVRVNPAFTDDWEADLEALGSICGVLGVVLSDACVAAHVESTFERLGSAVPVVPLLESALAIEEAPSIARASGTLRLAFGAEEYLADCGGTGPLALAYPRSRLVIASRLGDLEGPIDGPIRTRHRSIVRARTAKSVEIGMTGVLCDDGRTAATINDCLSPTVAELAWAVDVLTRHESNGRVITSAEDKPALARAARIQRRARVFRAALESDAPDVAAGPTTGLA